MTTELTTYVAAPPTELQTDMDYARAVSGAALLPAAYRGKPADVLVAVGLGRAIGIPPAQALYEVYVVNGRPSPSANLMAALVRRAGHKLRIEGDATRCTATLIRSDDPEAPFSATWTIEQARSVGLTGKDTWKQYPAAMLRARAIAEVVRMGASEAVLGMDYAREEMQDVEPAASPTQRPTGLAAVRAAVQTDTGAVEPPARAGAVEASGDPLAHAPVSPETGEAITAGQLKALHASLAEAGIHDRDQGLAYYSSLLGREVGSSKELTRAEASRVIDALKEDAQPGAGDLFGDES